MLAGLSLQVASLAVVLFLGADFAFVCARKPLSWNERFENIRRRNYFRWFVYGTSSLLMDSLNHIPCVSMRSDQTILALVLATVTILIRSIFRVAELTGGFHGALWNNEVDFMVLDGVMVAVASICLTVFHPGLAFHGRWEAVKRG